MKQTDAPVGTRALFKTLYTPPEWEATVLEWSPSGTRVRMARPGGDKSGYWYTATETEETKVVEILDKQPDAYVQAFEKFVNSPTVNDILKDLGLKK
jgi:hypothetical protein